MVRRTRRQGDEGDKGQGTRRRKETRRQGTGDKEDEEVKARRTGDRRSGGQGAQETIGGQGDRRQGDKETRRRGSPGPRTTLPSALASPPPEAAVPPRPPRPPAKANEDPRHTAGNSRLTPTRRLRKPLERRHQEPTAALNPRCPHPANCRALWP
ncbi:serine/arginine repetitive matrix protein 1-like [Penaeus indicus]|uniref:serine/arginine repetitive matrix protein 1-like n=1 Tax=Penaeus indicus TaxID=29960 RepID=UPI00300DA895